MAIVGVRDLVKSYGKIEAVRGISFDVEEGEVFGLLGPNGAGKTTTVEILEGLRKADAGTAVVDGIDVSREPARAKERVGVQLQQSSFPENFTAKETVELFALCYDVRADPAQRRAQAASPAPAARRQENSSAGSGRGLSMRPRL